MGEREKRENIFREDGKIPNGKFIVKQNCSREREREEIFHVRLVSKFEMKFSHSSSFIPH